MAHPFAVSPKRGEKHRNHGEMEKSWRYAKKSIVKWCEMMWNDVKWQIYHTKMQILYLFLCKRGPRIWEGGVILNLTPTSKNVSNMYEWPEVNEEILKISLLPQWRMARPRWPQEQNMYFFHGKTLILDGCKYHFTRSFNANIPVYFFKFHWVKAWFYFLCKQLEFPTFCFS